MGLISSTAKKMDTSLISLFSNFTFPSLNSIYLNDNATSSRSFLSSRDDDTMFKIAPSSSDQSSSSVLEDSLVIARPFTLSINYSSSAMIAVTVLLTFMVLATAFGNFLVGLALFRYRSLRTVSNILIGNLALSDFLLAATILPLSTINECLGRWVFGRFMCNLWLSLDVLYCTASIWNLCVIALDRYTATVYPLWYREKRSVKQAIGYIVLVWSVSLLICVPPVLGWGELEQNYVFDNSTRTYQCILFQSPGYVLYSASGSFYIPFAITLFMYIRIFALLRARSKALRVAREASRKAALKSRRHGVTDLQASTQTMGASKNPGELKNPERKESNLCACSNSRNQETGAFDGCVYRNVNKALDSNRLTCEYSKLRPILVNSSTIIYPEETCTAVYGDDSVFSFNCDENNKSSKIVEELENVEVDKNDRGYHQLYNDSEIRYIDDYSDTIERRSTDDIENDNILASAVNKSNQNFLMRNRTIESNKNSMESYKNRNKRCETLISPEVHDSIQAQCSLSTLCKDLEDVGDNCAACRFKIESSILSSDEPHKYNTVNRLPVNSDRNTIPVKSDIIDTSFHESKQFTKFGNCNKNASNVNNNLNESLKVKDTGAICNVDVKSKVRDASSCAMCNHIVNGLLFDNSKCNSRMSAEGKVTSRCIHTNLPHLQHDQLLKQSRADLCTRYDSHEYKPQQRQRYCKDSDITFCNCVNSDDNSNITLYRVNRINPEDSNIDMKSVHSNIPTIVYNADHLAASDGSDNITPLCAEVKERFKSAADITSEIQPNIISDATVTNCLSVPENFNLSKTYSLRYSRSFRPSRSRHLSLNDKSRSVDDYQPVQTSESKICRYEDRAEEIIESRLHKKFMQRELRATLRMSIIISMFCFMWIGFFIVYVIRGWCNPRLCHVPRQLEAFFFWLGYSNSSLNPVLYTLFNEDFRKAFRTILLYKKKRTFSQSSSRARRPTEGFTFRRSIFT